MTIRHDESLWKIYKKTTPPEEVFTTTKSVANGDNLNLLQIPHYAGLLPDVPYVVECIHVADNGLKSPPGTINFTPSGSAISPPNISFPTNNSNLQTGIDLVIQASQFVSTPAGLIHSATDWRIGTTNNPESLPKNESATNLTSYTVNKDFFLDGTAYFIFARYKSGDTYSPWSTSVKITTGSSVIKINKPMVTSPEVGATVNGTVAITMTSSLFSATGASIHAGSTWQISKDILFGSFIMNDPSSVDKTSHRIAPNTLSENGVYYFRVKHIGTVGESEWSDPLTVNVDNGAIVSISTPSLLTPIDGDYLPNTNVVLTATAFQANIPAASTHTSTLWEVSLYPNFSPMAWQSDSTIGKTSIQVPSGTLEAGKKYYVQAKYKSGSYSSEYSAPIQFNTSTIPTVSPVTIISPTPGFTLSVSNVLNIVASNFVGTGGAVFSASSFFIASDSDCQNLLWNTMATAPATSSMTVPANSLPPDMTVYLKVIYFSEVGNITVASAPISFVTTPGSSIGVVTTPRITAPVEGTELVVTVANNIIGNPFVASGNLLMERLVCEVSETIGFDSFVVNQEVPSTGNTTYSIPANTLVAGKTYYARMKYWGSKVGSAPVASNYSGIVSFKTQSAQYSIAKPVIINPSDMAIIPVGTETVFESTIFNATAGVTMLLSEWTFGTVATEVTSGNMHKFPVTPTSASSTTLTVKMRWKGYINNNPNNTIYSEYSQTLSYTAGAAAIAINTPAISYPADNAIIDISSSADTAVIITSSAFGTTPPGGDTHKDSTWQMGTDPSFSTPLPWFVGNVSGSQLTSVPILKSYFQGTNAVNNLFYFRVKYRGEKGSYSAWSPTIRATVNAGVVSGITRPVIVTPIANSTVDYTTALTFAGSNYSGGSLPHTGTDWKICSSYSMSDESKVYEKTVTISSPMLNIPENSLLADKTLFVACRYKSNSVMSDWSLPVSFKTKVADSTASITTPSITSPLTGSTPQSTVANVFTFSPFSGNAVTHKNAHLQISVNANFQSPVFDQTISGAVSSINVPTNTMSAGVKYYAQVQYGGTKTIDGTVIYSAWSAPISFTTTAVVAKINTPSKLTSTYSGDIGTTAGFQNISGSSFSATGGLTHTVTQWVVSEDPNFSSLNTALGKTVTTGDLTKVQYDVKSKYTVGQSALPPTFIQGKTYYLKYRYGNGTIWSDWSPEEHGTMYLGTITTPTVQLGYLSAIDGSQIFVTNELTVADTAVSANRIMFKMDAYKSTFGIAFTRAEVEVSTSLNGAPFQPAYTVSVLAGNDGGFKSAIVTNSPDVVVGNNITYYVRARYVGIGEGTAPVPPVYSPWSASKQLKVTPGVVSGISKPGLNSSTYSGNVGSDPGKFTIIGTTFTATPGLSHTSTQWEIYEDAMLSNKNTALSKTVNSGVLIQAVYDVNVKYPFGTTTAPPLGFVQGKTYWMRYRYLSGATVSPWSDPASGTITNGAIWTPTLRLGYNNTSGLPVFEADTDMSLVVSESQVTKILFLFNAYHSSFSIVAARADIEVSTSPTFAAGSWIKTYSTTTFDQNDGGFIAALVNNGTDAIVGSDTQYYVRARYVGVKDQSQLVYSDWTPTKQLKVTPANNATINTPTAWNVTYSGNTGTIGQLTFSGSTFSASPGISHTATNWEVYTNSTLTSGVSPLNKVVSSGTLANMVADVNFNYPTSGSPPTVFEQDKTYWIRYQYVGTGGIKSAWTPGYSVKMSDGILLPPTLTLGYKNTSNSDIYMQEGQSLTVDGALVRQALFKLSAYKSTFGITSMQAEVTVSTTYGGTPFVTYTRAELTGVDGPLKAAIVVDGVPATHAGNNQQYYVNARYKGQSSNGTVVYSAWTSTALMKLTTAVVAKINKPTLLNSVTSGSTFTINGSAFSATGGLSHTSTDWEIYEGSNKVANLSRTINGTATSASYDVNFRYPTSGGYTATFTEGKTYGMRFRHNSGTISSEWSDMVTGTIYEGSVATPTFVLGTRSTSGTTTYVGGNINMPAAGVAAMMFKFNAFRSIFTIYKWKAEVEFSTESSFMNESLIFTKYETTSFVIDDGGYLAAAIPGTDTPTANGQTYYVRGRYVGQDANGVPHPSAWVYGKTIRFY